MFVLIAAKSYGFEMFCTTDQGQRIGVTIHDEFPHRLLLLLSDAGLSDQDVETARISIVNHGWARCKYSPTRGTKNLLGVYPHIWNGLC
ncbi:hypothetical protein ACFPT7_05560 [Acidicapsa dinghuensis]|uniref:Uncharacterized protein n=1 Tax=Acidicapsa dinghuensis TaxID=2218256 RepID=A0ABW1ED05_9BACT|nr:hypothetical protein [Acidicapsa dinghuensis]